MIDEQPHGLTLPVDLQVVEPKNDFVANQRYVKRA
jgi:hypothetical protein